MNPRDNILIFCVILKTRECITVMELRVFRDDTISRVWAMSFNLAKRRKKERI